METRLYKHYKEQVVPNLSKTLDNINYMSVPSVEKIVINSGVGKAIQDRKILPTISNNIALICGQRPIKTYAKKSISNFKLRANMSIGCKVTLRKHIMWEFMDRLFNLALPQTRDFRGLTTKSFDKNGNYNLGIKEHLIFPEINTETMEFIHGLEISFITTTENNQHAYLLLKSLGMPFRDTLN